MMNKQQIKTVGTQAALLNVRRRVDVRLGFALLRDRRIPLAKKAQAILLGALGMLLIQVIEIPLEWLTVILGSPFGIEDGIEAIILPIMLASATLPYLAPKELVDQLRAERAQRL
jgi:hypothetical protein